MDTPGTPRKENSLYLKDGVSKIDGILVYSRSRGMQEITTFLENLRATGLILETEALESMSEIVFVKIHAPDEVLLKYAEIYSISFRKDQTIEFPPREIPFAFLTNILNSPYPDPDDPISKRAWQTVSKQKPTVITFCERSVVVFIIMDYIQYGYESYDIGIRQLLHSGTFIDAYPLHDGPWEWPTDPKEPINDRQLLAAYWANCSMFFKEQPLETVKNYFGYEIAVYFAWLGFYNKMLVYAAVLGVSTFLIGLLVVNVLTIDHMRAYCKHEGLLCNKILLRNGDFEHLEKISSTCPYVYVSFMSSNLVTLFYSVLIVLWCTIFKEGWKRKLHVLNASWDNPVIGDFVLRPQFVANVTQSRPQKYTGEPELFLTLTEQIMRFGVSIFGTILIVMHLLTVIGTLVGTYHLEIALTKLHYPRIEIILITTSASLFSMIVLEIVFNNNLLRYLARIEMPRTELVYERSIIVKSLLFSFFNNYGRLIYIAFIKGKLPYYYSVISNKYTKDDLYPFPSEYCLPPSCVFEIVCLLIAVLVFKPIVLNCVELFSTFLYTTIRRMILSLHDLSARPRWECDFALNTMNPRYILSELNKLVIQFGFIAFFAASCPLTPIIALVYNIITIRADASKIVKLYKRPIERKHISSIGISFDVFDTMAYVAITINALFMAYTCKFIHMFIYYNNGTVTPAMDPVIVNEYSEITFSYKTSASTTRTQTCYVPGFYEKTDQDYFQLTVEHYDFLGYKANLALAFMLPGFLVAGILSYIIPAIPRALREFIHYHEELAKSRDL